MYLNALIPFELRHIGQTFLIRFLCMELAVQEVVGEILWILNLSGTAVVIVFHSRPNISGPADTKHSFVIDVDAIVMAQVVIEPPAAFIRAFLVDFLVCQPGAHSPQPDGSVSRKPICSRQNEPHGAVRRLLQLEIPGFHDILEWLYKYGAVLLLRGIPPLYLVQFF